SFGWIKNRWLRLAPLFFGACAVFTVSLTGSRSGVIGLLAVLFFVWLTSKHKIAYATVAALLLAGSWFVLPDQYKERYSSITSSEYDPSTIGRFEAWEAGLQMFLERPFTGVGAGTFGVAYASGEYSERSSWLQPHSMYIQIIAELGILGLVTFGALVYYTIRRNFELRQRLRQWSRQRHWLANVSYAITCSMGALFITAIFGHSLFRLHWYWSAALTVVLWRLTDNLIQDADEGKTRDTPVAS
ncbi:MAG: O-antigen ligase family protein, partial [bacterium]